MVLEVADIHVSPGAAEAFRDAYRTVRHQLAETEGCQSVRMTQSIESPDRFVLLVEWDSIAAHEENFRATDRWVQWRAALGPHFAAAPFIEHTVDV